MNALDRFQDSYPRLKGLVAAREPGWAQNRRDAGFEVFSSLGFPTKRIEEWRHTNVDVIAKSDFTPPEHPLSVGAPDALVASALLGGFEAHRLVFVNGRFSAELSDASGLPRGVRLVNLASAIDGDDPFTAEALGRLIDLRTAPFPALNSAFMTDGALLAIDAGVQVERPIHIVFLAHFDGGPAAIFPRNLIVAGEGATATIVESYEGTGGGYFTNAVSEITIGAGANVDHYRLQRESHDAFHVSLTQVDQGAGSVYANHSLSLGGRLVRNDINAMMGGDRIETYLNGLFVADGQRHVDHHTQVDHAQPNGHSNEKYKGILGGRATGVFRGRIHVHPDAQKTDAYQNNKNLLLTRDATVHTKPQLEIYADDVKCSHGATVGQLDEEAIFYLRSRGVGRNDARMILVRAFAGEILANIKVAALREHLESSMEQWMPIDQTVERA
ncbi:MAG: Fe-S cluster assembly protein SufD [Deltaproteobacteria bacterium]|nr:Fe-S cluster assembly protein SufD [Deltaproteobacteria bacterium]